MARLYHALSSYKLGDDFPAPPADHPLVLQDLVTNDFAIWPYPYKRYAEDLPRTPLPRELSGLGRVLYLSAGVVRDDRARGASDDAVPRRGLGGRPVPARAVRVRRRGDGVHWYDPEAHALVRIAPPAGGEATTLIVTGVPWRTAWRYAERGFRHLYWDAGTMLAQTLALAARGSPASRGSRTRGVTRLVGADGTHEFPLALVALGDGAPRDRAGRRGGAAARSITPRASSR